MAKVRQTSEVLPDVMGITEARAVWLTISGSTSSSRPICCCPAFFAHSHTYLMQKQFTMKGLKVRSGRSQGESPAFSAIHPFAQADTEEPALGAELQMDSFSSAHSLVEIKAIKAGSLFKQMPGPPIEAGETERVTWIFSSSKCSSKLPQSGLTAQKCLTSDFWKIKAKMRGCWQGQVPFPFFPLAAEICWQSVVSLGFSRFLRGIHSKTLFL